MNENIEPLPDIKNVYTMANLDTNITLAQIETLKFNLQNTMQNKSDNQAILELNNLFGTMQIFLEKYFREKDGNLERIKKVKIGGLDGEQYDFYQIRSALPDASDISEIQKLTEMEFTIWNILIKDIGAAIPTIRTDTKHRSNTTIL